MARMVGIQGLQAQPIQTSPMTSLLSSPCTNAVVEAGVTPGSGPPRKRVPPVTRRGLFPVEVRYPVGVRPKLAVCEPPYSGPVERYG